MTTLALVLAGLLTLLAAALRFGGASLVRTSRAQALRDAAEGRRGAIRCAALLEDRLTLQPALGVVHAALLVAGAIPTAWALSAVLAGWDLAASLVGAGAVLVLAGDVLPRAAGRARPRVPAYRLAPLLAAAVRVGERATDLLAEDDEDEEEAAEAGEAEEIQLITSVLEFGDAVVREVMVPRADMIALSTRDDTDAALDVVLAHGRSRLPVSGDSLDEIVGVLYARDLLSLMDSGKGPQPVTALMRPPYFVPETERVHHLLRELQREKVHLAIVVDEFGSTAGLVTIEDLLEEIVGEIVDEHDVEEPMILPAPGGGFLVDARLPVDDLAELTGAALPEGDWDTVGGLLLGLAGMVPQVGEPFEVESLVLAAEQVQGRRVAQVRVTRR
ncbi:MAG: HlyC/CorC family transporter [Actinobacteria bacterium]|nr:HlyC/CorC family transporter [Actinomycetota bacterium]